MRSFVLSLFLSITILSAQDIAGHYKLSALDVQYYSLARENVQLLAQDKHGLGVAVPIKEIVAGEIFFPLRSGPYSESQLSAINVNLNIHLFADGTGTIAAGSSYPDAEVDQSCVTSVAILPITDVLTYTSNAGAASIIPNTNVAGLPSISTRQGEVAGSFSLSQSVVFDYYPAEPVHPTLCDDGLNCFDIILPGGAGTLVGGTPLPGYLGGYFLKEGLGGIAEPTVENPDGGLTSMISGNTDPQFYLEWHSIDGPMAESGLGDTIGQDEDGDGTDFDRIFGLPGIPSATFKSTADCGGYTQPIFGGQTVIDGILAVVNQTAATLCTQVGGLGSLGFSQCVAQATGADFAAACGAYGITASITQACLDAGGPTTAAEAAAMGVPNDATCAEFAVGYSAYGAAQAAIACGATATDPTDTTALSCFTGCGTTGTPTDAAAVSCIGDCGADAAIQTCVGLCGGNATCEAACDDVCEAACVATCSVACAATCQEMGPDACGAAIGVATSNAATSLCSLAGGIFDAAMSAANVTDCDDLVTGFGIYMQNTWETDCVVVASDGEVETIETEGYVMDPTGKLALWGNFLTAHGAIFLQTSAAYMGACGATGAPTDTDALSCIGACGGDATCTAACVTTCVATAVATTAGPAILEDDSKHDIDVACLSDGIPSSSPTEESFNCSGRLVMKYTPTCIPQVEMRQVIAEFTTIGGVSGCTDGGDTDYEQVIVNPLTGETQINPADGIMACNYDPNATVDDNTCYYGSNASPNANDCDVAGTCTYDCAGLSSGEHITIDSYSIDSIYPNPFNPIAKVTFTLPEAGNVLVNVYDITGRVVATLQNDYATVGTHSINWDASTYPSGLYLLRMESGNFSETQKVVLMK